MIPKLIASENIETQEEPAGKLRDHGFSVTQATVSRDIKERGRTVDSVIEQYLTVVRPGHYEFIEPTKRFADIIIPEGGANERALTVLLSFINSVISA